MVALPAFIENISPKTRFMLRMLMLSAFAASYVLGAFSMLHKNIHASFGFGTTAVVMTVYVYMCFKVQGPKAAEAQRLFEVRARGLNISAPASASSNPSSPTTAGGVAEDTGDLAVFQRDPQTFIYGSAVVLGLSFTISMTYLYHAISNGQRYTAESYWMGFMGFLMSSKWSLMMNMLMKEVRKDLNDAHEAAVLRAVNNAADNHNNNFTNTGAGIEGSAAGGNNTAVNVNANGCESHAVVSIVPHFTSFPQDHTNKAPPTAVPASAGAAIGGGNISFDDFNEPPVVGAAAATIPARIMIPKKID